MASSQDIAVVGYGCRLPQANSIDAFWQVLKSNQCVVTSVDADRWDLERFGHPNPNTLGKSYTWAAGQLDDVWGFDPGFFGISPREAVQMDPQQRVLLQVVWEALENAGIAPTALAGEEVGVYIGASGLDHANLFWLDPAAADAQLMTGNTLSIISNRVSYIYDLRGPSFTLDTACSSSLVALHEAAEAIRSGRIDTAIVGGANILLSPIPFVGFSRATMLSPSGLCQAFDAKGDGYVRSEGCVVFVLQRADKAARDQTPPHALLAATGINSDGKTNGLSLPSSAAQAKLLADVYRDFDIPADQLAFIEAHGTGTRVGDPLEAKALGETLGQKRSEALPIGSVKTNIGHLEAASGLAGLLKTCLALQHDLLPASLHFREPNPDIPFKAWNIEVAANNKDLQRSADPRYAGVNSFGFGGANAHVVVRDPEPSPLDSAEKLPKNAPLVLTARSEAALKEMAAQTHAALLAGHTRAELANGLAHQRAWHPHRGVVCADALSDTLAALTALSRSETHDTLFTAEAASDVSKPVFVYTGNGAQWAGMGQQAYRGDPAFRAQFEIVDRQFMRCAGWSLLSTLFSDDIETEIDRTEVAQPLLFAIQVALTKSLEQRGITPGAVTGHSVGEVAAAWAAGALTLRDAVTVIYARSTHQEMTRHLGTMAAVLQPHDLVQAALAEDDFGGVTIAAVNSPRSLTISGPHEAINAFAKAAKKRRWAVRKLNFDYPFHCALVDPIQDPLTTALKDLAPQAGTTAEACDFISTVEGTALPATLLDATYWWRNVRQPVLFQAAVDELLAKGHRAFLEIGPRPILANYVRDTAREQGHSPAIVHTLDRSDVSDGNPMDEIAARAMAQGITGSMDVTFGPKRAVRLALPTYPWTNKPFRIEPSDEATRLYHGRQLHLVGYRTRPENAVWTNHIDLDAMPWLGDHKVEETAVFPAAGFIDMALGAGFEFNNKSAMELREFDILQPLVLDGQSVRETQIVISPETLTLEISSRPRLSHADWTLHARGRLATLALARPTTVTPKVENPIGHLTHDDLYEMTARFGLPYGETFRQAKRVDLMGERDAIVHLAAAPEDDRFMLRPTHLDAALHGFFALLDRRPEAQDETQKTSFLPVRVKRLVIFEPHAQLVTSELRIVRADALSLVADMLFWNDQGAVVAQLEGIRFRRVSLQSSKVETNFIYRTDPVRLPEPAHRAHITERVMKHLKQWQANELNEAGNHGNGDLSGGQDDEGWLLTEAAANVIAEQALRSALLSAMPDDSSAFRPQEVIASGCLAPSSTPLFYRLIEIVERAARCTAQEEQILLADPDQLTPLEAIIETLLAEHPDYVAEATLLCQAAESLPALLRNGPCDTASDVYAADIWDQFAVSSALQAQLAHKARAVLQTAIEAFPTNRALDIVIIGANHASLVADLAADLDVSRMRLTLTGSSATAGRHLDQARTALRGLNGVRVDAMGDLDSRSASFDVVLGLAATADLAKSAAQLNHIRQLAVPDGLFLMLEFEPAAALDVLSGVASSWWQSRFNAAEQESTAAGGTRTGEDWAAIYHAAGYDDVSSLTLPSPCADLSLIACAAGSASDVTRTAEASGVSGVSGASGEKALKASPAQSLNAPTTNGSSQKEIIWALSPTGQMPRYFEAARTLFKESNVDFQLYGISLDADSQLTLTDEKGTSRLGGEAFRSASKPDHILVGFTTDPNQATAYERLSAHLQGLTALLKADPQSQVPLWLLTQGGARGLIGDRTGSIAGAGLWGYGRVAANEYPERPFRLLDLAPTLSASEIAVRLRDLMRQPTDEREIIVDADGLWGLRARRELKSTTKDPEKAASDRRSEPSDTAPLVALDVARQGSLESLRWLTLERPQLAADDVEIEVAASGLNFRDVMWAQGLLPAEALEDGFAGATLGMECAGRISRLGSNVKRFNVGDMVLAFAPACFASHVSVAAKAVARVPDSVKINEAATIPVAFLTTYYALVELARLGEDETILIHGGAGGVGLAALQIAKWRGARIIATAGNSSKRALLHQLGADCVLDSRSLSFEDEVRAFTEGDGVDCVLNSLFGDAMERSIGLLKPFGRFLELGKRDYYANSSIGLRPFRQNLSYFGIDADQLLTFQPKLAGRLLDELMALFADGTLTPLPHRHFAARHIGDAFRLMQKSGHIGKIIISAPPAMAEPAARPMPLSCDKTYVIAGGLGGFGLQTADWLINHGAHHIMLTSRRGVSSPEQETAIAKLRQRGVNVEGVACDITDKEAVDQLFAKIDATSARLGGILHTAMVLDDGLIDNLTPERIDKVLKPKVLGAEILDQATRGRALDLFVLFSSATTLVGNPGQANYVAANMALEELARDRRRAGEAGLAVAWGAISDAGYLARNQEVDAVLSQRLGKSALSAKEALDGLTHLLTQLSDAPEEGAISYARIDWGSARKELALSKTPLFEEIAAGLESESEAAGDAEDISALLQGLSPSEAIDKLSDVLAGEIGRILRIPSEELPRNKPLSDLGMDSLMALELRMAAEQRLGIDIPLMSLSGGVTLTDLSSKIVARYTHDDAATLSNEAATLASQHVGSDALSQDDLAKAVDLIEKKTGSVGDVI